MLGRKPSTQPSRSALLTGAVLTDAVVTGAVASANGEAASTMMDAAPGSRAGPAASASGADTAVLESKSV